MVRYTCNDRPTPDTRPLCGVLRCVHPLQPHPLRERVAGLPYHDESPRRGYFKGQAWLGRGQVTDEISLSLGQLGAPTLDTLAVLVHEMTHQWQAYFGAPTRSGYHNREWAARMETLGLIPSDTGRPGGKRTGQSMGHYVSDGGPFEQAAKLLRGTGWEVPVIAVLERPRPVSKLKYTCAGCGINVWGPRRSRR